jgi:hypothetical protein
MVGFTVGDASVRVMSRDDDVDQPLTDWVRLILAAYTSFATRDRQCTYACRCAHRSTPSRYPEV